jgi:hypothetical protein
MNVIVVFVITAITLFIAAFINKRRFGLLGFALAAGSFLSVIWGHDAELVVAVFGFRSSSLTSAVVAAVLVLLPAILLLFHGFTYKTLTGRVIGAGLFTVLALAFLVDPLGRALITTGIGSDVYNWFIVNKNAIIGAGLSVAVVDLFFTKSFNSDDKRHKH